jgi:hypothetical protein
MFAGAAFFRSISDDSLAAPVPLDQDPWIRCVVRLLDHKPAVALRRAGALRA